MKGPWRGQVGITAVVQWPDGDLILSISSTQSAHVSRSSGRESRFPGVERRPHLNPGPWQFIPIPSSLFYLLS